MLSFAQLWENMEQETADKGRESAATHVIRAGMNISPDFWDNFMSLLGDSDGVAELFDVPKEKVIRWSTSIKDALSNVNTSDDEESKGKKNEMLPSDNEPTGQQVATGQQAELGPTP